MDLMFGRLTGTSPCAERREPRLPTRARTAWRRDDGVGGVSGIVHPAGAGARP